MCRPKLVPHATCANGEHYSRRLLPCSRCLLTAAHMAQALGDKAANKGKGMGMDDVNNILMQPFPRTKFLKITVLLKKIQ